MRFKVIAGKDPGGVTKAQNWQGGGGYRFYELAPTLINKDSFDEYVINEDYDANMLAAAVALHERFPCSSPCLTSSISCRISNPISIE